MTMNVDKNNTGGAERKMTHFVKYYPMRFRNVSEEDVKARKLVWDFKDAYRDATEKVAQMTAEHIKATYGDKAGDIVFLSVPASTTAKNESRYKFFCHLVSELTGVIDGFSHISIMEDRISIHEHGKSKSVSSVSVLEFDATFFKGKSIILYDDIFTTGKSFNSLASILEALGAKVIEGIFLGKTTYKD